MHLSENIIVEQPAERIWALFNDPYFLPKWDRSVETIIPTSTNAAHAVGFTFDTIAPLKKGQKKPLRMSYRIIEDIPGCQTKIQLEKSNMFRRAVWTMRVETVEAGCRVTCEVDLAVRPGYFFMVPLLLLNKKALMTDLEYLRKAINTHYADR
jgi:hypothetical protein